MLGQEVRSGSGILSSSGMAGGALKMPPSAHRAAGCQPRCPRPFSYSRGMSLTSQPLRCQGSPLPPLLCPAPQLAQPRASENQFEVPCHARAPMAIGPPTPKSLHRSGHGTQRRVLVPMQTESRTQIPRHRDDHILRTLQSNGAVVLAARYQPARGASF